MIEEVDSLNEIIKEVAAKHGFVLSRDDPVLLVYTIQQRLLADSADGQRLLFDQFREELEDSMDNWTKETDSKVDQTVNRIITTARTDFQVQMQREAEKIAAAAGAHSASQVWEELKKCQRTSNISLVAAILTLTAAATVLWTSLG